jgi:DNA-directed RNA polymerase specialized sigma24 family protein
MTEFRARIEEEIPRLRRYARALTRNGSRCDDLIQDTLVRALAKEHLWEPGTNICGRGFSPSCIIRTSTRFGALCVKV